MTQTTEGTGPGSVERVFPRIINQVKNPNLADHSVSENKLVEDLLFNALSNALELDEITLSVSGGTIDDWNPASADIIFASGTITNITGLASSYSKDFIIIYNVGSSTDGNIIFKHSDSNSLENNRFLCPYNLDFVLEPQNNAVLILRDKINNKWRIS